MTIAPQMWALPAHQLTSAHVGKPFTYDGGSGKIMHARIAAVEVSHSKVRVFLDGLVHGGRTDVVHFNPGDLLYFPPEG